MYHVTHVCSRAGGKGPRQLFDSVSAPFATVIDYRGGAPCPVNACALTLEDYHLQEEYRPK